ncbi:DUF4156 domain-containing protein [Elongatibacter sediminis]|uniref:DUF4156 domain-containing protein n=1 Tax=Elongatibacter sediminis TaxID=3119006 RepID=A0AAW9R552_9GAMM
MISTRRIFMLATLAAAAHACTWVEPTPEGAKVRVAQKAEVQNCERKGEVASVLKSRIAGFERKPSKVAGELEALARNEAALMGGDTVVAESGVKDGRQLFSVYRCTP